jgi:hypothetical protein
MHWRRKYFTILSGQAISMITSGVLQMALIFYLTEKTGSALVLSLATSLVSCRRRCLARSSAFGSIAGAERPL